MVPLCVASESLSPLLNLFLFRLYYNLEHTDIQKVHSHVTGSGQSISVAYWVVPWSHSHPHSRDPLICGPWGFHTKFTIIVKVKGNCCGCYLCSHKSVIVHIFSWKQSECKTLTGLWQVWVIVPSVNPFQVYNQLARNFIKFFLLLYCIYKERYRYRIPQNSQWGVIDRNSAWINLTPIQLRRQAPASHTLI